MGGKQGKKPAEQTVTKHWASRRINAKMPSRERGHFSCALCREKGRQGTLFPVTLKELIPDDHVCRVIDAFVDRLNIAALGFERAAAAETGRPGYDPRDLLKLYLYGYLQRIRSSRRLEAECLGNIRRTSSDRWRNLFLALSRSSSRIESPVLNLVFASVS